MVKRRKKLDDLMDDTLTEILLRVPVKTAHQCKLISRRWLSLISSPFFVRRHRDNRLPQHLDDQVLLVNYFNVSLSDPTTRTREVKSIPENNHSVSFDFLNQQYRFNVVYFVSNDLLLTLSGSGNTPNLCICNPLTKQSYRLPNPPSFVGEHEKCPVYFRGCVCRVDEYKVVFVKGSSLGRSPEFFNIKIFSSDTSDWIMFDVPAPPNFSLVPRIDEAEGQYATAIHDRLYWCTNMIIIFDPFDDSRLCDFIHLPEDVIWENNVATLDKRSLCITNVEQNLRLYYWSYMFTSISTLSVWDMEVLKSARTWIVKYFVDLTNIDWLSINVSRQVRLSIKGFNPNDGDELYVLSKDGYGINDRVLAVNMGTKTVQLVSDFKSPTYEIECFRMFSYDPPLWPTPITKSTVATVL